MNQNDLRVIKTKKNIESSFISLLLEKDFHKITVQDILDRALINRSTFYKHYVDKYELATILCNDVFNLLKTGVESRFSCASAKDAIEVIKPLYNMLYSKREEVLALFKINTAEIHLYDDMASFLNKSFSKKYISTSNEVSTYLSSLYASLVMTSIKWGLENNGYENLLKHSNLFLKLAEVFEYTE